MILMREILVLEVFLNHMCYVEIKKIMYKNIFYLNKITKNKYLIV